MAKDTYRYLLRMPQALRERLLESAASAGRSFNGEVLHRLALSLDGDHEQKKSTEGVYMSRRAVRVAVLSAAALCLLGAAIFAAVATSQRSSKPHVQLAKAASDPDGSAETRFGRGNEGLSIRGVTYDDYRAAIRAFPAEYVNPQWTATAKETFSKIAARTSRAPNPGIVGSWQLYGPSQTAEEPGVLNFFGAPDFTASRTASLAISPACNANTCTLWAGPVGGGIWRTDNALSTSPTWKYLSSPFAQNSIGEIVYDLHDVTLQTLYVGTGEPNRCGSGCESGVGIYKTTDGGTSWTKLPSLCVGTCNNPGDAFVGRAVGEIVIDPANANHLFATSARARRGISHTIGLTGTQPSTEPFSNPTGLWESTDGGAHFTLVWNAGGAGEFGAIDAGLDPLDPRVVYASAFDMGVWRRCPTGGSAACGGEAGAGPTDFKQVFQTEFDINALTGRTMFDLTVKNNKTRIYLTDGGTGPDGGEPPAAFWRTDNANQTAAALLGTQAGGSTAPGGNGNPFPAVYNGWQKLSSPTLTSPYWATNNFCTGQCWYDQDVMTPHFPERPDQVFVLGSYQYGEIPCYTRGVGCGVGQSNGRAVLLSTTAGDPDAGSLNRTFTDMTADAQNIPGNWCARGPYQNTPNTCIVAHNSIHPDQHEIVDNPNDPLQFWEGSDGGIVRNDAGFTNMGRACQFRNLATASQLDRCQKLLSRVPRELHKLNINGYARTLQFVGGAFNPQQPCDIIAGTQDNGTWRPKGTCDSDDWTQIVYGDGGNPGFDSKNPTWMFNEFTAGFGDANFRNGDPERWVINTGDIAGSSEEPFMAFYWPQISDPNPPLAPNGTQTHPIFSGARHVWRSWAFGAGGDPTVAVQETVPQQTSPNVAAYEANCPEFVHPGDDTKCGDFQPLGGAAGTNNAGDLAGTFYGADRTGGAVSFLARRKGRGSTDSNTLWAATSAGRLFVTHNGNDPNPAAVSWHRVDNASSPGRALVAIYPDPDNASVAFIAYSGFNASGGVAGHVFRVNENGVAPGSGIFTNLNVEAGTSGFPTPTGNGDLPVNDVILDDANGNLYAATDFGVLRGTPGGGVYTWTATTGMPRFEVAHLMPVIGQRDACTANCVHALYAVTHSQGHWIMNLG